MIRKNEKGMTLVEILVAICLFGMTCAVLFTAILFALENNKQNVYAGREMQAQANAAEYYNDLDTLGENNVIKNNFGRNNQVTISAVFGEGSSQVVYNNDTVYAFQSRLQNYDVDAAYALRFFEPKNNSEVDPENGKYWVKIYNLSGNELDGWILPAQDVLVYGATGQQVAVSAGEGINVEIMDTDTGRDAFAFGVNISSVTGTDIFVFQEHGVNYYETNNTGIAAQFLNMTKSKFETYANTDIDEASNKPTGFINIYYYDNGSGLGYHTKDEYESDLANNLIVR